MAKHNFKTTNIKGKQYVEVNERIKYFRTSKDYQGWSLNAEMVHLEGDSCIMRAEIRDENWVLRATGYAQEDRTSSYINKTSYIENCETSAWGRALANLGIGIDTSIASANEVDIAIKKQDIVAEKKPAKKAPASKAPVKKAETLFDKALEKIKEKPTKDYYDQIMSKAGDKFTEAEKAELLKLIK
jgi:hypothetical protein